MDSYEAGTRRPELEYVYMSWVQVSSYVPCQYKTGGVQAQGRISDMERREMNSKDKTTTYTESLSKPQNSIEAKG